MIRTLSGRRLRLTAAAVAMAAASVGIATPALARGIFTPGKQVGTFKVLSGHVQQSVDYMDSFKITPQVQNDCWTYLVKDQGAVRVKLSFDPVQTSLVTVPGGFVQFQNPLRVSGTGSRKWSSHVDNTPGPNADDPGCANVPADPPHSSTAGCGAKSVNGAKSLLGLALLGRGGIRFSGGSVQLFGGFFRKDPFEPCPSDSNYGTLVAQAWSPGGANKLEDAKSGTTVKLGGQMTHRLFGPEDFMTSAWVFVAGSQLIHVSWSLTLKRM